MPQGGGFATGLAKGLFGELTAQRQRKEESIANEKQQTLKLLTGLLDQTEPESKPGLLRHIGEVMGLKGNQRGIWASLTGADLESDQTGLRSKLSEVLGSIRGPEAYKTASPKPTITGTSLGPGGVPIPTGVGKTPDRRDPRALYLRDPLQVELEKIEAKGTAQAQLMQQREGNVLARQRELQEDRQKFTQERDAQLEENKITREINTRATRYALLNRRPVSDEDRRAAVDDIEIERGIKLDKLRADMGLAKDRATLARAEAGAIGQVDPVTQLPVSGKAVTPAQNAQIKLSMEGRDRQRQTDAQALATKHSTAKALAISLGQQIQSMYSKIDAQGYEYDAKSGKLLNKTTKQPLTPSQQSLYSKPERLNIAGLSKAIAAKAAAMQQMAAARQSLTTNYSDMFEGGDMEGWDLQPKARTEGQQAPGALPRREPGGASPTQAKIPDVGQVKDMDIDREYKVGEIFEVQGTEGNQQYRVIQDLGKSGMKRRYRFRRIK